jgi:hypothetical protein
MERDAPRAEQCATRTFSAPLEGRGRPKEILPEFAFVVARFEHETAVPIVSYVSEVGIKNNP